MARTDNGYNYFFHSDGNGNVTALINGAQQVVASYVYDPFGGMVGKNGYMADVNLYRFSSKEVDPNSGLYYFGYRFFDTGLQRWITQDPLGEMGGINLYGFVGNSPANSVDPFGEFDWSSLWRGDPTWMDPQGHVHYDTPPSEKRHDPNDFCSFGALHGIDSDFNGKDFQGLRDELGNQLIDAAIATAGALFPEGDLAVAADGLKAAKGREIVAQNGTKVTGFVGHGIDRLIGDTMNRAGTKPQAILDALKNPQKIVEGIDQKGRPFQIFTGGDARVVVNPQTGKVISVNPLSGAGAH